RRYATLDELEAYAARVAGTIGAMMALLMGARSNSALARACDLGVAMQLTNIARDVGEDARAGRLYLPVDLLQRAGIDPDQWLAAPRCTDGVRNVVAELLGRADVLYARVHSGVAQLAPGCRPGINAARLIYADIGRVVRLAGNDSVSRRAFVPRSRKVWLLVKSYLIDVGPAHGEPAPPLAATCFLVDAVVACTVQPLLRGGAVQDFPWWYIKSRALWLLDLFERLERRERNGIRAPYAQGMADPGSLQ
ncbi:MAG: squalene/phytoene synthase family protein, partial [Dokdonella sp.]